MASPDDPIRHERRDQARAGREEQERTDARGAVRRKRLGLLGGVVGLATLLAVILLLTSSPDKAQTPTATPGDAGPGQPATALLDGIPQRGRILGSSRAPVTLVEFADLQCPFCKQYAADVLPALIEKYVRTGKVRMEFRPRTFIGPDSVTAARTVLAAGRQDKLWNVLDGLYANQGEEGSGWVTQPLLTKVVKAAGADPARVAVTAKTSAGVSSELRAADALADHFGLDGTPAFLVAKTGRALRSMPVEALTIEAFSGPLDAALEQ